MGRLRPILVAAGAALLLAAPAAVPAAGLKAGSYTGGSLLEHPALAYVLVKPGAESLDALVHVRSDCEAYPLPLHATVSFKGVELGEDGTATVRKTLSDTARGPGGEPAQEHGEAVLTLQVDEDGTATGGFRISSTFRGEDGATLAECDTGEVPLEVMGVPADAGEGRARRPKRGGTYLGVVNAFPLVAEVRRRGRIEQTAFVYRSACQRRQRIVFLPAITPSRKGAFRVRGTQQLFTPDGGVENVTIRMTGRYGRDGGLRGTVRLEGELDGQECDTGELRWRAARAP